MLLSSLRAEMVRPKGREAGWGAGEGDSSQVRRGPSKGKGRGEDGVDDMCLLRSLFLWMLSCRNGFTEVKARGSTSGKAHPGVVSS